MIYLLLSALFYGLPFWFTKLWPLIFLFPACLAYMMLTQVITTYHALTWTIVAFGLHCAPIVIGLYQIKHGLFRLLPPALLMVYVSLCTIIWLLITTRLLHKFANLWIRFTIFAFSLFLYLVCIDQYVLFVFGRREGLIFFNPLILLPPSLLLPISWWGLNFQLFIFALTTSSIGLFFAKKSLPSTIFLILGFIPWSISYIVKSEFSTYQFPPIAHIPLICRSQNPSNIVAEYTKTLLDFYPNLSLAIFPESAFNAQFTNISSIAIIAGIKQKHATHHTNQACCILKNQKIYHKRHAIPLAETPPSYFQLPSHHWLKTSKNDHPKWHIDANFTLVPYICSELFFNHQPDDSFDLPIVALCNDWWFDMPHFKKLMALAARIRAIQWQRPIIYVSYSYAQIFDEYGHGHPLVTTDPNRFIR